MKLFIFLAIAMTMAAVANEDTQSIPPRDNTDRIEALRRDVDLLLEANAKLEARLSKLETPPPAKQPEQIKQPKLVPSKVASDTLPTPTPVAKYTVDTKPGHWTYPGDDIDALNGNRNELRHHLRTTHGSVVDNMSNEQMLNMHDALHESEPIQPVRQAIQTIVQPVQSFIQQPSFCPAGQPCPQRSQQAQPVQTYTQPKRVQVFRRW